MIETLYMYRPVSYLGTLKLEEFAESIGLQNIVLDAHITLAYSSDPVDWNDNAFQPDPRHLTLAGGDRFLERFGDAVVMRIENRSLSQRWAQMIMAGASWDHDDYRPHVTLAYDPDANIEGITPPEFEIPLEPEMREVLALNFEPPTR